MQIRNSVKAVLVEGDRILLTKNIDDEGEFYLCPGGGQEHGETFHNTLLRECMEEIGQEVEIGELIFIREYIGKNHEYAASDFNAHQVEYFFACKTKGANIQPTNPDRYQTGIEWVPIKDLMEKRLYPKEMKKYLINHFNGERTPIYLGDIN